MHAEESEFQEIKGIREELQALKDRINRIETELDIREWKQMQSSSTETKKASAEYDRNLTLPTDDSVNLCDE